ncbi:serine kinase [Mycobacterium riyadhense]|nr:serine kinase [Mycobacterium riyadhense]
MLGVRVVTVSGGSWGRKVLGGDVGATRGAMLGGAVDRGVVDRTGRGAGAPTVALVVALSPLLMMTAVARAPSATTPPTIAATGRHRLSAGHASSP